MDLQMEGRSDLQMEDSIREVMDQVGLCRSRHKDTSLR
jgi:hypothetical protein